HQDDLRRAGAGRDPVRPHGPALPGQRGLDEAAGARPGHARARRGRVVRYRTCLNCAVISDRSLVTLGTLPELLCPDLWHHHHTVLGETVGAGWFDDVIIGGLGLPVTARRDTVLCACPEDGQHGYSKTIVTVPMPESECHCTAADVNRYALPV